MPLVRRILPPINEGPQGPQGPAGPEGPQGVAGDTGPMGGDSVELTWETSAMSDVVANKIGATALSGTASLYISQGAYTNGIGGILEFAEYIAGGNEFFASIRISAVDDIDRWMSFIVNDRTVDMGLDPGVVAGGEWASASANPLIDGEQVWVSVATYGGKGETGATGDAGADGADGAAGPQGPVGITTGEHAVFNYETSTTDSNPAPGGIRFNHASLSSATQAYVSNSDIDANTPFNYAMWNSTSTVKGILRAINRDIPAEWWEWNVTGTTAATGYRKITMAHRASYGGSSNPFSAGDDIVLSFSPTGDKGDTGAEGPQGATGPQGETGPQGADGAGLTDGDKGDVTVSGSGATWTIDNDAVTYAKMQNVSATDRVLGRSTAGAGDVEEITMTAAGRALVDDADAAAMRATLDLEPGVDVQTFSTVLNDLALGSWVPASNAGPSQQYFSEDTDNGVNWIRVQAPASIAANRSFTLPDATGTAALTSDITLATLGLDADLATLSLPASTTISAAGAALIDDADAAAQRATLGLVIGTNVQAYDADLATIAGLTPTSNNFMVADSSAWASRTPAQAIAHLGLDADIATLSLPASTTISAAGAALIDDADAAAQRSTLGLVIGTNVQAYDADLADIANIADAQGDIIIRGASGWERLAAGTSGHFLKTQGAAANPVWAAAAGGGGGNQWDMSIVGSDVTLNNNGNVQSWLPSSADTVSLAASKQYEFDAWLWMTLGNTNRTLAVQMTASNGLTFNWMQYFAESVSTNGTTVNVTTAWTKRILEDNSSTVVTPAFTNGVFYMKMYGTFLTTNAGDLTPQFNFSGAPGGTNLCKKGSYFKIREVPANVLTWG